LVVEGSWSSRRTRHKDKENERREENMLNEILETVGFCVGIAIVYVVWYRLAIGVWVWKDWVSKKKREKEYEKYKK
jgi:hypothetical protein